MNFMAHEMFLKFSDPQRVKFSSSTWKTNGDSYDRCQETGCVGTYESYEELKDPDLVGGLENVFIFPVYCA